MSEKISSNHNEDTNNLAENAANNPVNNESIEVETMVDELENETENSQKEQKENTPPKLEEESHLKAEPTLEEKNSELKAQLLRLAADFENFKRRSFKEKENIRARAAEGLVRDLLGVSDNFGRALEHADESPLAEGVKMVALQFNSTLEKHGAKTFDALGEAFDPEIHEAMGQSPSEEVAKGKVMHVIETGYKLNGVLIRPAKVIVSTGPAAKKAEA